MSDSSAPVLSESRMVGRVKWFNNKSGFGFITLCDGDDKDIFVHYTCLRAENSPYKYLVQGEYVEFDLVRTEEEKHEFHAANVSGIKGGLLMCQTHSLNNTVVRSYASRTPRRPYEDSGPPRQGRTSSRIEEQRDVEDSVGGCGDSRPVGEGFTEVKRRSAPRKRVAAGGGK